MKVVVKVTDINDNAPVFVTKHLEVDVNETALVGHVIFKAVANDSDEGSNGQVNYSIITGNDGGYFTMNQDTGDVTLEKTLDMEQIPRPPQRFTIGKQVIYVRPSRLQWPIFLIRFCLCEELYVQSLRILNMISLT